MNNEGTEKVNEIRVVSDEDSYLWAYISFKYDIQLLRKLNEEFPKFVSHLREREFLKMLIGKGSADLKNMLQQSSEIVEKISRKTIGKKDVYFSIDEKDETQRFIWEGVFRTRSTDIVREMSLVYLIAMFESFLQKILLISFKRRPETLMTSKKNVTYEELLGFSDIDDAKQEIMEKETMIVNEDIESIRLYLAQRFSIDISQFVDWNEFKERFYRRNILIHNSGMPNKIYRLKTGYKGENRRISVSKSYLESSINLFDEMSQKVFSVFKSALKI